jgi:hypothetical protein
MPESSLFTSLDRCSSTAARIPLSILLVLISFVSSLSAGSLPATFSVPAANPAGISTGIAVNAGDVLSFTATGTWCWEAPTFCSDANGTPGRTEADEMFDTVIPTSYFGTLIGSLNGTYFPIGSSATLMMPANARSGNLNLVVMQGNQPSNTTTLPVSN